MRAPRSVLSALVTAGFLLCISIAAAFGEDKPRTDVQPNPRQEWYELAKKRTEFEVSDPALLPTRLALAVEQSGCDYKGYIKELPVQFISAGDRRIALVFCRLGVGGSHQVFDFTELGKPRLVELAFIAQKEGFGTTPRPGLITWRRDAGVFEAVSVSDTCPNSETRHTYRLGSTEGYFSRVASFVVVRVEAREKPCDRDNIEWTTVWEAPPWPKSVVVH